MLAMPESERDERWHAPFAETAPCLRREGKQEATHAVPGDLMRGAGE
jgi:hypothetical protein